MNKLSCLMVYILIIYKLLSDWERLPRACSGPQTPNDSLVKRRITLSSSLLAKLEGWENFLQSNYLSIWQMRWMAMIFIFWILRRFYWNRENYFKRFKTLYAIILNMSWIMLSGPLRLVGALCLHSSSIFIHLSLFFQRVSVSVE